VRRLAAHVFDELPAYKQENGTRKLSKSDTLIAARLAFGRSSSELRLVDAEQVFSFPEVADAPHGEGPRH